ncbi:MAG: YaaL family protein [Clostridia bacterium]|nr:YaaL family protein [Clostridia bacterium]
MQEEYLLEKMIKGKTDKEKEREFMQTIIETKEMLKVAICNFDYAEDDLIDYYTYQIKAHQAKLDYLIKIAKRKGFVLSRVNELKTRMDRENNLAG